MEQNNPDSNMDLSQFSRLIPYIRRYQTRLIVGFLCVIFSNLAATASPWFLKLAIDSLDKSISSQKILGYGILIIVFAALSGVFLFLMRRIMIGVSRYIEYDIRNDLFAHFLKLSCSFYQENRTGDLLSRSTSDMNAVRTMIGPGIMYSTNTFVRLTIVLYLMLSISPMLTLFSLIIIPLVSLAVKYFGSIIHNHFEKIQETFSELSSNIQENLAGVRVLRAFNQEEAEIEKFRNINQKYLQNNVKLIRIWAIFYPSLSALLGMGTVCVLWLGGGEVINGNISLGEFVAFNVYLTMLTWPMIALGWVINIIQRGAASLKRIGYIFQVTPDIFDDSVEIQSSHLEHPIQNQHHISVSKDLEKKEPKTSYFKGEIEIKNLCFSYNSTIVINNLNLTIPAGSTYAIVGETGSGKSTLVKLLARIIEPSQGQILIDGKNLQDYPLKTLRSQIGYVPQEAFLFSDTIKNNIAFGSSQVGNDELYLAAIQSNILSDIQAFPQGFQTMVGERGVTLSGGQQQRTAIARTLIRNPQILILDDSLSSVDTLTEEQILKKLKKVMVNRTSLLISHRVSTVRFSDHIVVLKKGVIVEQGNHHQLIEHNGYYADLHKKQLLKENLEEE